VQTPDGKSYDVLFIGTDNGKVIKVVNADSADSHKTVNPVVIEEIQVFPLTVPIRNLQIVRDEAITEARLVVVTDSEIKALPLHRCNNEKITSCRSDVTLR
jgi:semaphorin 6